MAKHRRPRLASEVFISFSVEYAQANGPSVRSYMTPHRQKELGKVAPCLIVADLTQIIVLIGRQRTGGTKHDRTTSEHESPTLLQKQEYLQPAPMAAGQSPPLVTLI